MENQNNQNINPTPSAPPIVQAPPVSNQINPPTGRPKSKLPILIIGIILFLLVAGSAASFYVFKPQIEKLFAKPTPTPKPGCFYQKVQCIQAPCPPVLVCPSTTSPTPNPTANWKTYLNEKNDFTFKYPGSWKLEETNGLPSVKCYKCDDMEKIYSFTVSRTEINSTQFVASSKSYKSIKIDQKDAVAVYRASSDFDPPLQGPDSIDIFLLYNNKGYILSFTLLKSGTLDTLLPSTLNILSTFKFTNQPTATPSCNSDADCGSNSSCMTAGPLIAGQTPHKICVQKGTAIPL